MFSICLIQNGIHTKHHFYRTNFRREVQAPIIGLESYWMLGMGDSLLLPGAYISTDILDDYAAFNQADMLILLL